MNIHQHAVLTPRRREQMVLAVLEQGLTLKAAAAAFRVSGRTVSKWLARFRLGGAVALQDRSSRPKRLRKPTPFLRQEEVIALRRQKLTGIEIARRTGLSRATVSRLLRRARLNRWRDLFPAVPVVRYERPHPGDLLHLDIKKLPRIHRIGFRITGDRRDTVRAAGHDFVFVAIDDHSRLAHAAILPNEQGVTAVAFLHEAVAHYHRFGVKLKQVMTDNGACFRSDVFAAACQELGLKHIFTRPYTPRTNGKAERFIQSSLREWAYAHVYPHSNVRTAKLSRWIHRYNWHRPHSSLGLKPPVSRLPLTQNNLLTLHSYPSTLALGEDDSSAGDFGLVHGEGDDELGEGAEGVFERGADFKRGAGLDGTLDFELEDLREDEMPGRIWGKRGGP
jgi:transposase InsO family protein